MRQPPVFPITVRLPSPASLTTTIRTRRLGPGSHPSLSSYGPCFLPKAPLEPCCCWINLHLMLSPLPWSRVTTFLPSALSPPTTVLQGILVPTFRTLLVHSKLLLPQEMLKTKRDWGTPKKEPSL